MQIEHIVGLIAAVVLFLYGIEHLSMELRAFASGRLREILQNLTKNRWAGAVVGAGATAAIQSSTAVTVLAVGLVDAGIIPFVQSLGVIAGANVGTTITAQLVAFKFTALAPIFIIFGFLMGMFGNRLKFIGKAIFYFGFLFFAIGIISDAVGPFKEDPAIMGWLSNLDNPLVAIAAGAILTILLVSSSATTGIVVVLSAEGLLGLGAAIPIIMGANLGTTFTSVLASLRMGLFAKRTAFAHIIFNFCGVLIFLPILAQFTGFVEGLGGNAGQMVANAHTIFNLATAVIFLMIVNWIVKLSEKVVPGREREVLFRTEYIEKLPENPDEAIIAIEKELRRQLELVKSSFYLSYGMLRSGKTANAAKVEKMEMLNKYLEEKISAAIITLSFKPLSKEQSERIVFLSRASNKIEHLGDLSEEFSRLASRLEERGEEMYPAAVEEMDEVKKGFDRMLGKILEKGWDMDRGTFNYLARERARTEKVIQVAYRNHIKRLADAKISAQTSTIFVDAVYSLEQANSALLRLGRLLATIKKLDKDQ